MQLIVKDMTADEAKQISKWTYEEPYSIYSMGEGEDTINELMSESYFSVYSEEQLIGYYCFGEAAQVPAGKPFGAYAAADRTDIGLGIRPDLCGQGLGPKFFRRGLDFAREALGAKSFRLTVAAFNERAIKTYLKAGFEKVHFFERVSENARMEFWVMV